MDHKNAVKLLDETFNRKFDLDRFSGFIKELFNHFSIRINNVPIRKEYYDYIDTVTSLGVYRDENKDSLEVFSVKLKKTSSRDRARTMQRNLIAKYLENFNTDAALVAFYGEDPQDWRFSFVKMEYELIKDEKDNLKVRKELTPARRFSYLVGQNEPNHTCRQQFLGLVKEESIDPKLEQIESAFSIENVTKEFFNGYKELYLKLKESLENSIENDEVILQEFEDKSIKTSDFSKKLMGQIVFIYFLQKKGWLGVEKGKEWGTGPKRFLRKLFDKEIIEYNNFFNDVLEYFFYEALASKSDDDYYERFKCKIPFLNGGLFETINDYDWKKTNINLKNEIFKEILDTFDRFNFTVKEDEPLEKEVAVDPEMLGKVFENLLEIEDRKSRGAFYTPREIVHYMCQESLINYLDTNSDVSKIDIEDFIRMGDLALGSIIKEQEQIKKYKKSYEKSILPNSIRENHEELEKLLTEIKVVDPAVGSGAFPVGMMNEIIRARTILSLYSGRNVTNYELKLETIEKCLYGVDIDSSAVDIAKLRFWLSLIVDEDDVTVIDPLPNLDHRIMCGNSLLEEFEGKKLFDENLLVKIPEDYSEEIKDIQTQIDNLHRKLGEILTGQNQDEKRKNEIQNEIKKLQKKKKKLKITSEDLSKQFTLDQDFNKRVRESQLKLKDLKNLHKQFFKEQDSELKKEYRDKIDRIEWELIEETLKEEGNEESLIKLSEYKKNKSKPFFLWKLYFSEIFQRKNPGFDVVIANPPYGIVYDDVYKKIFEEKFSSFRRNNDIYIAFYENSLNLAKNNGSVIYITPNTYLNGDYFTLWRKKLTNTTMINEIRDFKNLPIFADPTVFVAVMSFIKKKKIIFPYKFKMKTSINHINAFTEDEIEILQGSEDKLKASNPLFKKILNQNDVDIIDNHFYVKDVGFNYWTKGRGKKRGGNSIGKRVLYKGKKIHQNDIPFLKGRDITKYYNDKPQNYLKHDYKDYLDEKIDTFRFSEDFLKRNPKVIYRQTSNKIIATLDSNSYYLDKTVHLIVPKDESSPYDLKYILALLNSKLFNYLYEFISQEKAGRTFAQVKATYIKQLPFKKISNTKQRNFINLVNKIFEITNKTEYKENKENIIELKELENKIDEYIYRIYDLTSEEITIINNFNDNQGLV